MTTNKFTPRVRKGIALIEKYEEGATDRIDLETLDLYSLSHCASAQSVGNGSFGTGQARLGIPEGDDYAAEYGFAVTYREESADHEGNYKALREAWVTELTEHRNAKES